MKVAAILKERGDDECMGEERTSDTRLRDVTQKLVLALIESEINAAFIFLAVARTAYRSAKVADGNTALSKAEAIYLQVPELARDIGGEAKQAIADQLSELRQAVDGLRTGDVGK